MGETQAWAPGPPHRLAPGQAPRPSRPRKQRPRSNCSSAVWAAVGWREASSRQVGSGPQQTLCGVGQCLPLPSAARRENRKPEGPWNSNPITPSLPCLHPPTPHPPEDAWEHRCPGGRREGLCTARWYKAPQAWAVMHYLDKQILKEIKKYSRRRRVIWQPFEKFFYSFLWWLKCKRMHLYNLKNSEKLSGNIWGNKNEL